IAYPAKTRREVAGSGTKPTSPPPGPDRTAAPPSAFAMIPDAEVGMNQGSTFARGRIPPTMAKIRVNRKNVRTVAATVPFNSADRRYATPTTAVMYPSVYTYERPTSQVKDPVMTRAAIAAAPKYSDRTAVQTSRLAAILPRTRTSRRTGFGN